MKHFMQDPYRSLFPMGLLCALFSIFLWTAFAQGWITFYPGFSHAALFFYGFFAQFIAGFLLTAVPKMTNTQLASPLTVLMHVAFGLTQILLAMQNLFEIQSVVFLLQFVFILYFIVTRILKAKRIPFEGFYFFPFAFISLFLGIALYFLDYISYSQQLVLSGELFIMNLIFGLGSRMIPAISRIPGALSPKPSTEIDNSFVIKPKYFVMAFLLNLIYAYDIFYPSKYTQIIKFIFFCYYSINYLGILKLPSKHGFVAWGLKVSLIFILVAPLIGSLSKFNHVSIRHLLYIGGIFLLTLLIATRVMLAHGKESLDFEIKSPILLFLIISICFAAIARFLVNLQFDSLIFTSALASMMFAVIIWGFKFLVILMKDSSS